MYKYKMFLDDVMDALEDMGLEGLQIGTVAEFAKACAVFDVAYELNQALNEDSKDLPGIKASLFNAARNFERINRGVEEILSALNNIGANIPEE